MYAVLYVSTELAGKDATFGDVSLTWTDAPMHRCWPFPGLKC